MNSVCFATHCHSRDLPRLHAPGVLEELIQGHGYPFDEIIVVHQRCGGLPYSLPTQYNVKVVDVAEEDYPSILRRFGIPHDNPMYWEVCHGWNGAHGYAHHCVNHCKEILTATSDYIVFSDADCHMISQPPEYPWVKAGIKVLQEHHDALIVAPSDGGKEFDYMLPDGTRMTRTVSQQLFMAERKRFLKLDFTDLQWDGKYDAPYGPFQEFYVLFEGWMFRWMRKHGLYRAVLPEAFRYWNRNFH